MAAVAVAAARRWRRRAEEAQEAQVAEAQVEKALMVAQQERLILAVAAVALDVTTMTAQVAVVA